MRLGDVAKQLLIDPRKCTEYALNPDNPMAQMIKPDLFDVIEILVDIPESGLHAGDRGAIVEKYPDQAYEVEFTNSQGETLALCTLSPKQFIVVWQAKTQIWVSLAE